MVRNSTTYDVFISHSIGDRDLAREIASVCIANGLQPFTNAEVPAGMRVSDVLWEALSESKAVIAILSRSKLSPSMAIELGGAQAWNKPIFGVLTDPTLKPELASLGDIHLYASTRIDDVIKAIKASGEDFSEKERNTLASIYSDTNVSVDQLALDPRHLQTIVKRFVRATGKIVTGERLLSELLRMRKQGRLVKGVGSPRQQRHPDKD
jgi:hypothetical protein